ncbi:hypothetical protein Tcan_01872 [Toxocara canis]|uniref:Uncharacterized protein n=1 Tax=Toxocara canis TaxID=6265 RepID=A0A0B2W579_TOXCA|nr:hypothetical protein Tcan_01872 [Toxocara canis]
MASGLSFIIRLRYESASHTDYSVLHKPVGRQYANFRADACFVQETSQRAPSMYGSVYTCDPCYIVPPSSPYRTSVVRWLSGPHK